jgi:Spy/CpxP family protein refolding chaperone
MFRTRLSTLAVVVAASVSVLAGGCGVGSGTSGLAGLLSSLDPNASSLSDLVSSLDPNVTVGELLNQLTLGDLVSFADQWTSSFQGDANGVAPPFWMRPDGCPGDPNDKAVPAALNLTDEQQADANSIFASAREDIDALRQDANDQIRALLTEEQLAALDALEPNGPNEVGPGPCGLHQPPPCPYLDESLNLTDEQRAAIKTILDNLHTATEAREQQARDEFRAILTEDQLAVLDQMRPRRPQGGPHAGLGGPFARP